MFRNHLIQEKERSTKMRKRFMNGKRVMSFVLALSMVVGEAGIVTAAPAQDVAAAESALEAESASGEMETTPGEVNTETDMAVPEENAASEEQAAEEVMASEGEAGETGDAEVTGEAETAENAGDGADAELSVSVNDMEDGQDKTDDPDMEEQKDAEEADAEEELEADGAYDGSLSKVIGVKADSDSYIYTDDNGIPVMCYAKIYDEHNSSDYVLVSGKVQPDASTGQYQINGKWYKTVTYAPESNTTTAYKRDEVYVVSGTPQQYREAASGLYIVNGKRYSGYNKQIGGKVIFGASSEVFLIGAVNAASYDAAKTAIRKTYGRYTKSYAYYNETSQEGLYNHSPQYYEANGIYLNGTNSSSNDTVSIIMLSGGKYVAYTRVYNQIIPDGDMIRFSWNSLSLPKDYTTNAAGQQLMLDYELKINGTVYNAQPFAAEKNGTYHTLIYNNEEYYKQPLKVGDSVTVQVRGVCYHYENKTGVNDWGQTVGSNCAVIDSFGEWSDPFVYKNPAKTAVPAVTSLSAQYRSVTNSILLKWNAVKECSYYYLYRINSKKALNINASNFVKFYNGVNDSAFLAANSLTAGDIQKQYSNHNGTTELEIDTKSDGEYRYHYFAVVPIGIADESYRNVNAIGNIKVMASAVSKDRTKGYTPAISNFKAEAKSSGTYDLVWDPVDAPVMIYAYDSASFPAYYQYYSWLSSVKGTVTAADGSVRMRTFEGVLLSLNKVSKSDYYALRKVRCYEVTNGSAGILANVYNKMGLMQGKTYYFVARTYDETDMSDVKKSVPLTYTTAIKTTENGVQKQETKTFSFDYYPAIGAATKTVKIKQNISKPSVNTLVTKNSVKLTMGSTGYTGYEIYRKVGKKFKKITTITDRIYLDEGLKANTTYTYKVRAYNYSSDTKKTYYGDYRILTVKTGAGANIDLNANKLSATKVKLKWTKVSAATKYEIYRSGSNNADTTIASKKYSAAGVSSYLYNSRYELVKTITKNKTTSFTDKGLTAGESYSYVIVAYYKNGSKTEYVTDSVAVATEVETPRNIRAVNKGSKVIVTWDADKCASKYEIQYTIYDKYGKSTTELPKKATTKKNTFTVTGVELGGKVTVSVRAYGKNKKYSQETSITQGRYLSPVKGIKASNVKKNGKSAVKISWKKVSGAKYYVVYRSTYLTTYDADKKIYKIAFDEKIAAESNDNYVQKDSSITSDGYRSGDEAYYKEYLDVSGSVIGTSAYDFADLDAGVKYYYYVIAYADTPDGRTDSRISSEGCSKPASVVYAAGMTIKATSKKGKVTLKWDKVSGAKQYTIYRATKKNGPYTKIGTAKKATFTDKKSKKGKTYYYKVAVTSGKNARKADIKAESAAKKVKAK